MATLNVTPDSFSDGGEHNTTATAMKYVQTSVAAGADVIDVGGYSTRPGSAVVSPEEEADRVCNAVRNIRAGEAGDRAIDVLISVDTFRGSVAELAIREGADIINDVYAFSGDAAIEGVARDLDVPVVMMHSRGDAGQNKDYSAYKGGVMEGIERELGEKISAAVSRNASLRRWNVIVDPGVGFSKTVEDNCTILQKASDLTSRLPISSPFFASRQSTLAEAWRHSKESPHAKPMAGMPLLIGSSRKSFLGALTNQSIPRERVWATAAAVSASVQQGAEVVRVHDVAEMRDVVRVARGIWRSCRR